MSDISRSAVSIRFYGAKLNPNYITQLLGCEPSSAAKTGEKIIRSNGTERIVKKGFWFLNYGESDEIVIGEKIETLFGKMTDNLDSWREVTRNLDTADIFCGLFIDNWNEGFSLSQSIMKKYLTAILKSALIFILQQIHGMVKMKREKPQKNRNNFYSCQRLSCV